MFSPVFKLFVAPPHLLTSPHNTSCTYVLIVSTVLLIKVAIISVVTKYELCERGDEPTENCDQLPRASWIFIVSFRSVVYLDDQHPFCFSSPSLLSEHRFQLQLAAVNGANKPFVHHLLSSKMQVVLAVKQ